MRASLYSTGAIRASRPASAGKGTRTPAFRLRPASRGTAHSKSRRSDENLAKLDSTTFEIVPLGAPDARAVGAVRAALERSGHPTGPHDVLIAGQARARGLVLVTANVREFVRVDRLVCEN